MGDKQRFSCIDAFQARALLFATDFTISIYRRSLFIAVFIKPQCFSLLLLLLRGRVLLRNLVNLVNLLKYAKSRPPDD